MGNWETERGVGSDAMADILGKALAQIAELPGDPNLLDLADAIEFVTRGIIITEIHPDAPKLGNPECMKVRDLSHRGRGVFETIPNRGQIK